MTFTYTTGTFGTQYNVTFNEDTECDILMVAGGGGGSQSHGGGGGAGAIIFMKSVNMNGDYILGVGKGGTCEDDSPNGIGFKGNASSIIKSSNQIITEGGGGGESKNTTDGDGQDGGSGGGGDGKDQSEGLGGSVVSYTPTLHGITGIKYGNHGGNAKGNPGAGGAGGGAGSAASHTTHGNQSDNDLQRTPGGQGISKATVGGVIYDFKDMFDLPTDDTIGQYHSGGTYNGSSYNSGVYFGGGGGNGCYSEDGGDGGLGGGGNGGPHTGFGHGLSGQASTGAGGGGGGGDGSGLGGDGGSGIIIIRYKSTKESVQAETINDDYKYFEFLNTGGNQTICNMNFSDQTEVQLLLLSSTNYKEISPFFISGNVLIKIGKNGDPSRFASTDTSYNPTSYTSHVSNITGESITYTDPVVIVRYKTQLITTTQVGLYGFLQHNADGWSVEPSNTVAKILPLLDSNHFEESSDKISLKNFNSYGEFDYNKISDPGYTGSLMYDNATGWYIKSEMIDYVGNVVREENDPNTGFSVVVE